MIDVKYIPKIELHVHLDGSVRVDTANEILERKDCKYDMIADKKCHDLNDYLTKFDIPNQVMQTSKELNRVAYELATDLKNDGVIYAEIRFAPLKHLKGGLDKYQVVEAVLSGLSRVDLKTNVILCMMRGDSYEDNLEVIEVAKHFLNKGVCAIDLAGAEAIYPTKDYEELFEIAKKYNIPFTIHAGEASGSDSIKDAVSFGAKRLGHGVRVIEDKKLMEELKNKDILLEVCPTSNIQTNIVDTYKEHPLREIFDYGIKVCINTDNRTVSNTTLKKEYQNMIISQGFTIDELLEMNREAVRHAFLSEEEKRGLLNKITI